MTPDIPWWAYLPIGNYILVTGLWLLILLLYLKYRRIALNEDSLVAVLAGVMALDAFKNVAENAYFGLLWAGEFGIGPETVSTFLSQPLPILFPKVLNLVVALCVLAVVLRRWIPRELEERRKQRHAATELRAELMRSLEEIRQKEERWQLALLASQDGIWDYDLATNIGWSSPRFHEQLGEEPGAIEHITREQWRERVHPDDLPVSDAGYEELRLGRQPVLSRELRMRAKDGSYRLMLSRAAVQFDDRGEVARIVVSHADITDLRRTEEALAARQRTESLGLLAGGIAHDFNNLLTVIRANSSLARDGDEATRKNALDDLDDAIHRATELTTRLLAYSGRGKLVRGPLSLENFAREMVRLVRTTAPSNVRLDTSGLGPLADVLGDSAQIQQVLLNLFTNAIEAIEDKPGVVSVRTRSEVLEKELEPIVPGEPSLPPGVYSVLEVEDTGVGMDESTLAHIFEPFFTSKPRGRGLGLSAMFGILRSHGAGMRLRSTPGVGTCFTLYFPPAVEKLPQSPLLEPLRVLLVDDDEVLRRTFQRLLEQEGFEVDQASGGMQALERLSTPGADYALMVLDLNMPAPNGLEVLRIRRAFGDRIPVLLTSGSELPAGVLDPWTRFLQKPFRPSALHEAIAALDRTRQPLSGAGR